MREVFPPTNLGLPVTGAGAPRKALFSVFLGNKFYSFLSLKMRMFSGYDKN